MLSDPIILPIRSFFVGYLQYYPFDHRRWT